MIKNKFILTIVILAVIIGTAGIWYYQRNIYSKEILKLEILGPAETELAQEIEYIVKYKNNGNVRLEEPRLILGYPEHALVREEESRKEIVLDDIYPGQEQTFSFKTRLLGREGEIKKVRAWLNYRPKNLKARYESETSYTTQIKFVPLTLEFDLPSKIDSGKEISFKLNYFSNVDYPLSNLGIKIEYPDDFEFQNSKPQALGKTDWEIGLLNKAEGGRIEVAGNLRGEIGQQKQFKAQLGSWQAGEFVLLKETIRAIQIVTPSLYISQQINNNPQYVATAGDALHYEIFFKNIGSDIFSNLFLVAKLEGEIFDLTTLRAPLGGFESGDNSIIFDWRKISKLQFLDIREEGRVEFWVELKDDWQMPSPNNKNQVLRLKIYLSQAQKEFITKVNSRLEVSQNGYYQDEVFGNTGPVPPEVNRATTYTIIWQAKNYYNDVKSAKIKAILGSSVRLTGKIFPEDAKLTFDSNSREVVWDLGDLEAGKGVFGSGPSVTFQVVFTPTSSQEGKISELISKARITGEDQFTELIIKGEGLTVDTALQY